MSELTAANLVEQPSREEVLQPARELLAAVSLEGYLATRPPRAVTSVAATDRLGQVLRRFASAGLVAAPLFADKARTQYLGFIDLLDVVVAVVEAARQRAGPGSGRAPRHCAAAAAHALSEQPVGSIRAAANDAQVVYPSQLGSTLLTVVRQGFADPVDSLACHRLAVLQPSGDAASRSSTSSPSSVSSSGEGSMEVSSHHGCAVMDQDRGSLQVSHIVSQSDVLRFLDRRRMELGPHLLNSTLAQLGFREKPVMCVPADMAVLDALAGMVDAKVPAVAVVDSFESGRLLSNLSISDLRGILPEHFEQMVEPVGDFLSGGWRGSPHWQPGSPRGGLAAEFGIKSPEQLPHEPSLVCCTLDSRFGEVLHSLVKRRLHRLYIRDAEGRPLGVCSATDILRLIAGDQL